jgi:P4 family phage/plasmid primase-like protien
VSERVLTASEGEHSTELMDLMDLRIAILEELPGGRYVNAARMKSLTGTHSITARRMRQDPVTFTVTHSLCITSNYRPKIVETDHGTWRRLLCVPFPYRFVDDPLGEHERQKQPWVRAALREGDPAVLAWLVEGARRALTEQGAHDAAPVAVRSFTNDVRADNDTISAFLAECTAAADNVCVPRVALYQAYSDWMKQRGRHAPDISVFEERLLELVPLQKSRKRLGRVRVSVFCGIELTEEAAHLRLEPGLRRL